MKANYLTPVITAFKQDRTLDHEANRRVYDFLIQGGVDGIVVLGSTGEFFSMPLAQKRELIELALGHINKRTKVIIGTGGMSVEETIQLSNHAYGLGADGVMVISPYYFSLSPESVEAFYDQVARGTGAPIYLYNFPARTGYDLSPELTLRLLRKHNNLVGYKDTVTEMGHTRAVIAAVKEEFPNFEVYSGFDENFAHNVLSGGSGCIGGLANMAPEICSAWTAAVNAGNFEKTALIQKQIDGLMGLYQVGNPFIPMMKKAMILRGLQLEDQSTAPFLPATEEQTRQLVALLKAAKLLD